MRRLIYTESLFQGRKRRSLDEATNDNQNEATNDDQNEATNDDQNEALVISSCFLFMVVEAFLLSITLTENIKF